MARSIVESSPDPDESDTRYVRRIIVNQEVIRACFNMLNLPRQVIMQAEEEEGSPE